MGRPSGLGTAFGWLEAEALSALQSGCLAYSCFRAREAPLGTREGEPHIWHRLADRGLVLLPPKSLYFKTVHPLGLGMQYRFIYIP